MVATTTVHVRTDRMAATDVQPCMCPPVQILYTLHVLTSKTKLNATRGQKTVQVYYLEVFLIHM